MLQFRRNPLRRYYGSGRSFAVAQDFGCGLPLRSRPAKRLNFITTSCYRRKPLLGTARARDVFLAELERVRRLYRFDVVGFVVMPEHVHLLLSEPERANPSVVMQVLKKNVSHRLLRKKKRNNPCQIELWKGPALFDRFWQRRFYDFNVFSEAKIVEKLRYMHRNPEKRGLVSAPELWRWSSYRVYAFGERGPVNMDWMFPPYVMRRVRVRRFGQADDRDPVLLEHTHPANRTQGAAPTIRYQKRKSKP